MSESSKKRPLEQEEYGEGFKKGKQEAEEHFHSVLYLVKEHLDGLAKRNNAMLEVESIKAKIKVHRKIIKDNKAQLAKLKEKLAEAEDVVDVVDVKNVNWEKLGLGFMMDAVDAVEDVVDESF